MSNFTKYSSCAHGTPARFAKRETKIDEPKWLIQVDTTNIKQKEAI